MRPHLLKTPERVHLRKGCETKVECCHYPILQNRGSSGRRLEEGIKADKSGPRGGITAAGQSREIYLELTSHLAGVVGCWVKTGRVTVRQYHP